jgi:hypothetical protein
MSTETPILPSLSEAFASQRGPKSAEMRWLERYDWAEIPYASQLFSRVVIFRVKGGGPLHALELNSDESAESAMLRWAVASKVLTLV